MAAQDPELDFSTLQRTEGWIKKKGGAVNNSTISRHNWKKRWFVLKYVPIRNKPNYQLHYFDQPRGTLKGKVDLTGTEVYCDKGKDAGSKRAKHDFQILLNTGNTLYLSCDNLEEREEWLDTFNLVLFRLRKAFATVPGLDELLKGYDPAQEDDEEAFAAGDEIAHTIQAFGPGLFGAEVGQQAQFVLQMYDKDGTAVNVGGLTFTASLEDDDCLYHIRVVDNENGTYSAHYVVSRPSKYTLSIRLNDEHEIFGSPFPVDVVPSRTVPEKCTCDGDCLVNGLPADQTSSFTVYARDQFGNKKQSGGDMFELGVMGPAELKGLDDNGDGTYTCSIDAHNPLKQRQITSASLMITVTLYGKHVAGSPFRPTIIPSENELASNIAVPSERRRNVPSSATMENRKMSNGGTPSNGGLLSPQERASPSKASRESERVHELSPARPAATGPGSSMSRLDAARQRAMGGIVTTTTAEPVMRSPGFQSPDDGRYASKNAGGGTGPDLAQRLSRLEQMTRQVGQGGTATAAISTVQARRNNSHASSASRGSSRASEMPPPPPQQDAFSPPASSRMEEPAWNTMSERSIEESRVDKTVFLDSMSQGIVGQAPHRSTDEERRLLAVADDALRNKEVARMLSNASDQLSAVFRFFYDVQEEGIGLAAGKWGRGIYKLLEEYDVLPSYCSKKDVKTIFGLVIYAEMPASSSRGYMNFHTFVKLLVTLAVFCLSNPPFSTVYQSSKAKVEVLLAKWGLGDEMRLKLVQKKLSR